MSRVEIRESFYIDGEPFRIISGSFHYFRTVPEYWRDRLEKLVNMGCNTVETYIPWNFHEPKRGIFLWSGMRDVERFITIAEELGLYVIVRPSPYICAEWEFGGLPAWLLRDRGMRLRCSYQPYLDAVREYYSVLVPKLVPHQIDNGGRIILMQLENEYGYYGNDNAYLEFLRDTLRELGVTVPFVTSDGPWSEAVFRSGGVEGALQTGNFGSDVKNQFDNMRRYIGADKPLMCMEFWCGWFDMWTEQHHSFDAASHREQYSAELEELLTRGNVNFYMFEGGTNFGFTAGRNAGNKYADVTSYDYDALLTEDGRITEKYKVCRDIISKHAPVREIPLSMDIKRAAYGKADVIARSDLLSVLDKLSRPVHSAYPLTMEELGEDTGYIVYRFRTKDGEPVKSVRLEGAADRVQCFINGKPAFTAENDSLGSKFDTDSVTGGADVILLCENIGRVNFGTALEEQRKGITGGVVINDHRHYGFDIYPLTLDPAQLDRLERCFGGMECPEGVPTLSKAVFEVEGGPADTFLDLTGFGKGAAFVNGFNLGRYWEVGPQKRLYIPAPLLKSGRNELVIRETEGKTADFVTLCGEPLLG